MWPDSSRRSEEIHKISGIFDKGGLGKTGSLVDSIAQDIVSNEISGIDKKYLDVTKVFREEYCNQDRGLDRLFNFVMGAILIPVIQNPNKFSNKLHELNPWLELYKERVLLLSEFARHLLTQKGLNDKTIFLDFIVVYGWTAEGLFKEAIRLIHILVNMVEGRDIKYPDVQETKIWKLRDMLKKATESASEALFFGYEDAHLRNAIFHFRFMYEAHTGKMRFQDFQKGKLSYDKTFSLDEFRRLYRLLNAVDELIMLDILIIRIADLIYFARPFDD